MANKFIGETSGKYWKQKNDETYVNEDELVKITDLEEGESVDDDDLLIKGNQSTGTMLRIKVANFLDGIKEKLLGNTDISSVGDGTVTGAISENAENISANKDDADSKYNELNSALATSSNNGWLYRTYPDGYIEMWYRGLISDVGSNTYSGVSGWYYTDSLSLSLPVSISNSGNAICTATTTGRGYVSNMGITSNTISFRIFIMSTIDSGGYTVHLHLFGKT